MTQAEEILQAVAVLIRNGRDPFSRQDIREQIGIIDGRRWQSYDTTFQTMRSEREATNDRDYIGANYRGVFRRVAYGRHTLTDYGRQIIRDLGY